MSDPQQKSNEHWWMIRAGRRGEELIEDFLKHNQAFVGFTKSDLSDLPDKASIHAQVAAEPGYKTIRRIEVWAAQLYRFRSIFDVGDYIVTGDSKSRVYYVGRIVGRYRFDPTLPLPHVRAVTWTHRIPRAELSVATTNSLGSVLTIFELPPPTRADILSRMRDGSTQI